MKSIESIQREIHDMFLNVHSQSMINIKTTNNSITHFVDEDSNFEDRACFGNVLNKFIEEASVLNSLNEITAEGFNVHCMTIYGWRNMEPAIPVLNSDVKNASFYSVIEEVFCKEIEMIEALSEFRDRSVAFFSSVIHGLKSSPQHSNSGKLRGLMKLLDLFLVLDVLKGCKISITNNFTFFCKLFGNDMDKTNKWIPLRIFTSSQDVFMQKLKETLSGTDLTDIFIQMLDFACDALENKEYLLPNSKYFYLRSLCAVMFVLENKNCSLVILDSKKKINLSRITKILKDVFVIPILGDTVMKPMIFFQKLPSFSRYTFPSSDPVPEIMAVSVSHFIRDLQDDVDKIMIRLVKLQQNNKTVHGGLNFSRVLPELVESHYLMMVDAVNLLSRITCVLNEVYSFKMNSNLKKGPVNSGNESITIPNLSTESLNSQPGNIDLYLTRTQNNFSSGELKRFIKLISFNRMIYNELTKCRIYFDSVVRYYFHRQLQTIIQSSLTDLAAKFEKSKKRSHYHQFLFSVSCMCMDSNKLHVKVSSNDKKNPLSFPEKSVSPTSTQMYLIMRTIRFCLNEPEIQSKLDNKTRKSMEAFLKNCFFCEDMLKLSVTLDEASNLGLFWFREHFLDICRPHRVQYPIENSFVCILLKQSMEPPYVDWIAHLLDLYNDSARWTLHTIRRQFLYSELESELNVCFQTLVLELGMKIYTGFRMVCSNIHLDKSYRSVIRMNTIENPKLKSVDAVLYVTTVFPYLPILRQRNLNILGRSVNLNYLFNDCLTDFLSESLMYAIKNLHEKGVSYIFELYTLYAITKSTHQLISHEINLMPFEMIESISTEKFENSSQLGGGLTGVVADVLLNSLIRNYVYCASTDRFTQKNVVRPKVPEPTSSRYIHTFGSRYMNSAFADLIVNKSLYFGGEHVSQILELIGYSGLADIISLIVGHIKDLVTKDLIQLMEGCEFLHEPMESVPFVSGFNHYVQLCRAYSNKIPVLVIFKAMDILTRIGNCLVLILMIERTLIIRESFSHLQSAPLLGILPTSSNELDEKLRKATVSERHRLFPVQSQYILQELIPDEVARRLSLSDSKLLLSERLSTGMGFFQRSLIEIKNALVSVENRMKPTKISKPTANKQQKIQVNSSLLEIIDKKNFFSRLWSTISFIFCAKTNISHSSRDQFGDASIFAAVTIITLLGQENVFRLKDMIIKSVKICDFYSFSGQGSFIMDWMTHRGSQNSRTIRNTISNTLFRTTAMMRTNSKEKEKDSRESEKLNHVFRRHSEIQDIFFCTIKNYINPESQLVSSSRNIDCFLPPIFTPL